MRKFEQYQDMIARLFPELGYLSDKKTLSRTVTFQVTDACNLACSYCYQINKGTRVMSFETAKKFVDDILSGEKGFREYISPEFSPALIVEFIGGEPFLQIDLIDQICDYLESRLIETMHPWATKHCYSICSNGTLYFDPKVQKFLHKHRNNLSFSVTIDGNKELHDSCRVFPDGRPSYDLAVAAAQDWMNRGYYMGSKITIAPGNLAYLYTAICHMIHLGYDEINANCVFEKGWEQHHATEFYWQLKDIADKFIDENLVEKIYCSLFVDTFFHPKDENDLQNWCGGTGSMLSCDPDGYLYPCIRYMESSLGTDQPPMRIGHVDTGIAQTACEKNCIECLNKIDRRTQSTDECFYCPIAEGCAWCFPAGTKIKTPYGQKNIEDILVGDIVLDGFGNTKAVVSNMSRVANSLMYVNACGVFPTLVTKEHPFYAKKVVKRIQNIPVYGDAEWVKAEDLQVADRIALPLHSFGDTDVNKRLAFILGLYLGDGWKTASNREKHPYRYYICCDKKKTDEVSKLFDDAGIQYSINHNRTVDEYNICITGQETLVSWLDDCGRYAKDKHLPKEVYNWNKESVSALLDGYFYADGNKDRDHQRYSTISKDLLFGIGDLVKALYHKPVYYTKKAYKEKGTIEGRSVNLSEAYTGSFKLDDGKRKGYEYDEAKNILWVNVRSYKGVPSEEETVYNLTVDETHSYIANEMLVHNCSAYNYQTFGTADKRATYICEMHKARALANVYYWNKWYRKTGNSKRMPLHCPESWALRIIPKEEFETLQKLAEEE